MSQTQYIVNHVYGTQRTSIATLDDPQWASHACQLWLGDKMVSATICEVLDLVDGSFEVSIGVDGPLIAVIDPGALLSAGVLRSA